MPPESPASLLGKSRHVDRVTFTIANLGTGEWLWRVKWHAFGDAWQGTEPSQEQAKDAVRSRIERLAISAAFADDEATEAACATAAAALEPSE